MIYKNSYKKYQICELFNINTTKKYFFKKNIFISIDFFLSSPTFELFAKNIYILYYCRFLFRK